MPSPREGPAILLSAFGIHVGGGLVLLRALLRAGAGAFSTAALDARLEAEEARGIPAFRVPASIVARLGAIHRLAREARPGDVLFCFNGLPPLLAPKPGVRVVCFIQAPHFVGDHRGIRYTVATRVRIGLERAWLAAGARHCDEFWVQTPTMRAAFLREHPAAQVQVVPFVDDELFKSLSNAQRPHSPAGAAAPATFFYPAELVGHKNHATLVRAWALLREQGCDARLQLTLRDEEWRSLSGRCPEVATLGTVTNLGRLPRAQVIDTMRASTALLFASRAETFGLPLLEAAAHGVPVLAAERDFVRDVCVPAQTFDPSSKRSIADAVLRFLGDGQRRTVDIESAAQVMQRLLAR